VVNRAELINELRLSWSRLLPLHPMLGEGVLTRLSGSGRASHDLQHLKDCLLALTELGGAQRAEYLALWYHNAVNSAARQHPEQASAALAATELLGVGLPWVEVGLIARLILATGDHQPKAELPGSDRVCDADLAGLAGRLDTMQTAFDARKAELSGFGEHQRDTTVQDWIDGLLARERIFHTERGYELWEAAARRNLAAMAQRQALA